MSFFCPYCGKVQRKTNTICINCERKVALQESIKDNTYYLDEARILCTKEFGFDSPSNLKWFARWCELADQLFIENEVASNPLYDPSIGIDPNKNDKYEYPLGFEIEPEEEINVPKCPTCGSTHVEKISVAAKAFSFATIGLLSSTVRSQFKCKKCGYKW